MLYQCTSFACPVSLCSIHDWSPSDDFDDFLESEFLEQSIPAFQELIVYYSSSADFESDDHLVHVIACTCSFVS